MRSLERAAILSAAIFVGTAGFADGKNPQPRNESANSSASASPSDSTRKPQPIAAQPDSPTVTPANSGFR